MIIIVVIIIVTISIIIILGGQFNNYCGQCAPVKILAVNILIFQMGTVPAQKQSYNYLITFV